MFDQVKEMFHDTSDPSVNKELEQRIKQRAKEHDVEVEVMRTANHRDKRVLYYKYGCEFCKQWLSVVDVINNKMDRTATPIRKIDVKGVEPEKGHLEELRAPTLIIDGIVVVGITTSGFGRGFLKGFLEDELVID